MAEKCQGVTSGGSRCQAGPLPGERWCFFHHPDGEAARREAARKGGRARSHLARARKAIPPALSSAELAGLLSGIFRDVAEGKIPEKRATAAATVARVVMDLNTASAVDEIRVELDALKADVRRRSAA